MMRHAYLFCLLALGLSASPTQGQIKMDASGRIGLGGEPQSSAAIRAYAASQTYGLYVTNTTAAMYRYSVYASTSGGYSGRGIYGRGSGAIMSNYGGHFSGSGGSVAYGVYGSANDASTNYAGYFSGNVHVTGTLTTGSDARLKEEVEALAEVQNTLGLVMQLRPSRFRYTTDLAYAHMNLPEGLHYGLIAQEVEAVLPELVREAVLPELVREEVHPAPETEEGEAVGESLTYKSVDYQQLIPLLIRAVQEQQAEIEALRAALRGLGIEE